MKRQARAYGRGLPVGMTAMERARPASAAAAGSIPAISTLPGCGVRVSAPLLGSGRRGSSPCFPTVNGSLAHREERRCEVAQARGSSPRETTVRMSFNGRTSVFHTDNESSTLSIRSAHRLHALVLQRQRGHVEDVDSAGSSPAERTRPARGPMGNGVTGSPIVSETISARPNRASPAHALRTGVRGSPVGTRRPDRHRGRAHAVVAQGLRAPRRHRGGPGFESR
jgi:hypothetical protein